MTKTQPSARVIEDSITVDGDRLTTVECVMHRFVLAEWNTHRVFSRNSASSRAVPTAKQVSRVLTDPALPVEWGTNQKGMQAAEPLQGEDVSAAIRASLRASHVAVAESKVLSEDLNVHKQLTNRILEPWMWHTVITSSTEWENFFNQRCSPLAQPEIRVVAEHVRDAMENSVPKELLLGDWHLPYILPEERGLDIEILKKVSAARCARVSYLTQSGVRDIEVDLELFERLTTAFPPHASPLEHVATPYPDNKIYIESGEVIRAVPVLGNFLGYKQLRHEFRGEKILGSYP